MLPSKPLYQNQSGPSYPTGCSPRASSEVTVTASHHLLEKEDHAQNIDEPPPQSLWRRRRRLVEYATYSLSSCLLLAVIVFLSGRNQRLQAQMRTSMLVSPANEAVEWRVREWNSGDGAHSEYVGEPSPELESAWSGIFDNMNVRISEKDIAPLDRADGAVAMPDGTGFIGTLNVYHELHCVWFLYKYVHKDHYFAGASSQQEAILKYHSHHCLNTLRKFAMCHGDVGLVTYSWLPNSLKPAANGTAHQCIDWDRLADWSKRRAVNMSEPGFLIHPTLGPVFADGRDMGLNVGQPPDGVDVDG